MPRSWVLLALAGLAGCRTTAPEPPPAPPAEPLPYHVAVVPVLSRPPAEEPDVDEVVNLRLDSRETSRALLSELDGRAFTKATLLRYPAEAGEDGYEEWGADDWAAYWARASSELGADLVLECDLVWASEVESERNDAFWWELPLFLLGGPFCWFVDDHTFHPEALLSGRLSHLPPRDLADDAPAETAAPDAAGPRPALTVEAAPAELSLDYVERAGSSVWRYVPTLVCPPGLLGDHDRRVERRLTPYVTADLAARLAGELAGAEAELAAAPRVAPFELRPGTRVVPDGDLLHVLGEVVLHVGPWPPPLLAEPGAGAVPRARVREVAALARLLVGVGDRTYAAEFAEGIAGEGPDELRYPFHVTVPRPAAAEIVRLAVFTAGDEPLARGYTLAVPGVDAP